MTDLAAWCALGVSVVAVGRAEQVARKVRRSQQAIGPAPEVRAALAAAREGFQDIITQGGADTDWFLHDDRRLREQDLRDAAKRVGDESLRIELGRVADEWKAGFGAAHAPIGSRIYTEDMGDIYAAEDAAVLKANTNVIEHAREGSAAVEAALTILNRLERKAVRP